MVAAIEIWQFWKVLWCSKQVFTSIVLFFHKQGGENCLEGLTFVITGVLESFERDEAKHIIEKYGGKVTGNVSKRTDYVVAGRDPGQSKISKVKML